MHLCHKQKDIPWIGKVIFTENDQKRNIFVLHFYLLMLSNTRKSCNKNVDPPFSPRGVSTQLFIKYFFTYSVIMRAVNLPLPPRPASESFDRWHPSHPIMNHSETFVWLVEEITPLHSWWNMLFVIEYWSTERYLWSRRRDCHGRFDGNCFYFW